MKHIITLIVLLSINLLISNSAFSQSVGISGEYFSIDSSALLELKGTDKGFLMTRLTTLQRDSICIGGAECYGYNPAEGLVIFNTTTKCYEGYIRKSWVSIRCALVCGDPITDLRDSKKYATVKIGNQCWMAQNLAYLPAVHDNSTFVSQGTSSLAAYGVYGYNGSSVTTAKSQANYSTYGVLYNWWAAMAGSSSCNGTGSSQPACSTVVQGVCPSGWHLPSHYEWVELERAACSSGTCASDFPYDVSTTGERGTNEGSKLAGNPDLWANGLLDGNANFGDLSFSVRPGGGRYNTDGTFVLDEEHAYLWSSTENDVNAWLRNWVFNTAKVNRISAYNKAFGLSIRCLQD